MMRRIAVIVGLVLTSVAAATSAGDQAPPQGTGAQPQGGRAGGPAALPGPRPTHADLDYAPPDPATSNGHKLDLYIPSGATGVLPVVIWTGGSAWMADTGKRTAPGVAAQLNPAGYAVAGVSIRSSSQVQFPGQLHDIKAAIRWLRANAPRYNLDPNRIAIMGDSSGGWTTAMAALTGDAPEMEGSVGTTGVSSKVQAAVAFYPPTNFLTMDAWALKKCGQPGCHDEPTSPESRLVGCAIQTCPEKVQAANPVRYVTAADPPMMILHGGSDPLVPHNQGEQLYMALNKACLDAVFISLPKAGHGPWNGFLTDDAIREAATVRSTAGQGCAVANPAPFTPSWKTVIEFLDQKMRAEGAPGKAAAEAAPPATAAATSAGPTTLTPGQAPAIHQGTVVGRGDVTYTVPGRKGQTLVVDLQTTSTSLYFDVLPAGSEEAVYASDRGATGNKAAVVLPADGDYRILVYLFRNEARRGTKAAFTISLSLK